MIRKSISAVFFTNTVLNQSMSEQSKEKSHASDQLLPDSSSLKTRFPEFSEPPS